MAGAIVRGGVSGGVLNPALVRIAEPDAGKRGALAAMGIRAFATAAETIASLRELEAARGVGVAGVILLAVKPQSFAGLAEELKPVLAGEHGRRTIVSIMAGVSSRVVRDSLSPSAAVVRVMPNTPAALGLGCSALSLGEGAMRGDEAAARAVFASIGTVIELPEDRMNAFTALAGSGPAYVFLMAEALAKGGAAAGLGVDETMLRAIVAQVIRGSAEMLRSGDDPALLRAAVTSKGGTTAAALAVLEEKGVVEAFTQALVAARDRGEALSAGTT